MRETRRADQMLPGISVRFTAGPRIYAGTIASTRPIGRHRIEFGFVDRFRWTFRNSDLFYRDLPDDEADGRADAADRPAEYTSDELAAVPA
jgi:hypothetical protein